MHFTTRKRRGNPEGKSILRNSYRNWYFKKNIQNIEGIGIERDVGGMPVIEMPDEPLQTSDEDALKKAMQRLRMDEQMFLQLPFGVKLTPYASGSKAYNIRESIDAKTK